LPPKFVVASVVVRWYAYNECRERECAIPR
jgi:hypothetical protein